MNNCAEVSFMLSSIPHKEEIAPVLLAYSPVAILLNAILAISLIATKQVTKNSSNLLIFIITISDLTSSTVGMPLGGIILLNTTAHNICIKVKVLVLISGLINFSAILTVLTAVDRYLHMNPRIQARPSLIKQIFEKPALYYLLILVFIISFSPPAVAIAVGKASHTENIILALLSTGLLSSQIVVVTTLYTIGYMRIRRFADNNPVYHEASGTSGSTPDYVRRLYKTVLALILLAFLHILPLCLVTMTLSIGYMFKTLDFNIGYTYLFEITLVLYHANCITNSIAVLYFNKRAKCWILSKIGCKRFHVQAT